MHSLLIIIIIINFYLCKKSQSRQKYQNNLATSNINKKKKNYEHSVETNNFRNEK